MFKKYVAGKLGPRPQTGYRYCILSYSSRSYGGRLGMDYTQFELDLFAFFYFLFFISENPILRAVKGTVRELAS